MKIRFIMAFILSICSMSITAFCDSNLTRSEFCSIAADLYRELGGDVSITNTAPFTDISSPDVDLLYGLGIVNGVSEKHFAPNDTLTREQACKILTNVVDVSIEGSRIDIHKNYVFDDDSYISHWAKNSIDYLYHHNIIKGTADYTITPLRPVSRTEAEALASRIALNPDIFKHTTKDNYNIEWLVEPKFQNGIRTTTFSGGLAKVMLNDKFGYIDTTGTLVIKCIYNDAYNFSNGLARVKKDEKYGFIDKTGKIIIPFSYDEAGDFSQDMAWVKVNDKFGFINTKGTVVIPPIYSYAGNFKNGLASVSKDNKYGYINKENTVVIDFKYLWADDFSEGLAGVQSENQKCGFINAIGDEVIPCKYESVNPFSCERAVVHEKGSYSVIDKNDNTIIPFGESSYMFTYREGLALGRNGGLWEGAYSYYDLDGNKKIASFGADGSNFSEGIAWIRKNSDYGIMRSYIDKTGAIILPNRETPTSFCEDDKFFSVLNIFSEGYAAVETSDGKLGFIKNPLF